ncbi:MAG: hypothetical protein LBT09_12555 [Planctomycetaceae bacterium]|nr:hypothetical protein [Planctomycetaceae bacterium]
MEIAFNNSLKFTGGNSKFVVQIFGGVVLSDLQRYNVALDLKRLNVVGLPRAVKFYAQNARCAAPLK